MLLDRYWLMVLATLMKSDWAFDVFHTPAVGLAPAIRQMFLNDSLKDP